MKISSTQALIAANLLALAGMVSLWIDQDGQLRNVTWPAPQPVKAESGAHQYFEKANVALADPGNYLPTLERPLFAPDRKQPPPPPPPAPPPAPDSLADARLVGVVTGTSGAVLIRSEGRVRRLTLNQPLGEWILKAIGTRDATFERNEEMRVLRMEFATLRAVSPEAAKAPVTAGMSPAQAENYNRQLSEQEERERRVAEMRAKMKP